MAGGNQLGLFDDHRSSATRPTGRPDILATELSADALVGALPDAGIADAPKFAAEAARRRLMQAVPALDRLCRRFTGFGEDAVVTEQKAALQALAEIGGAEARKAVVDLIRDQIVQGPNLPIALDAAMHLGALLPTKRLLSLLNHAGADIRVAACRCCRAPTPPATIAKLIELLGDHPFVSIAAACALGRLGRTEARPHVMGLLRDDPSPEAIEAAAPIADHDTIVLLRRIGEWGPSDLRMAVLDALDRIEDPHAVRAGRSLRKVLGIDQEEVGASSEGDKAANQDDTGGLIQHVSELPAYSPPAHSGTVNRRLVGREFGAGFEMILGRVAPGGEASRHYHVDEAQIVYLLKGEADVTLGDAPARRCGPGTVIRIPKGLAHEVVTVGDEALECLVLYAPPLGPHGFVEVPRG